MSKVDPANIKTTKDTGSNRPEPTKNGKEEAQNNPQTQQNIRCMVCQSEPKKILVCADCGKVAYCGKKCQKEDYPTHKYFCRPKDFGLYDSQKYPLISIHASEEETFFIAKERIKPLTELLSDDPIFFIVNDNIHQLPDDIKKNFMGEFEDRFFWSGDKTVFNPQDSHEYSVLKLAIQKAGWVSLEPGLRLKWIRGELNKRRKHFPKNEVVQWELDKLHKEFPYLTPHTFYVVNGLLSPSFVHVYSRTCFNILGKGFFKNAWRLSTSCSPNSVAVISEGRLKVISAKEIMPGDKITVGFNPFLLLNGLAKRREMLYTAFGISECYCDRCISEGSDGDQASAVPTELMEAYSGFVGVMKNTELVEQKEEPEGENEGPLKVQSHCRVANPDRVLNAYKKFVKHSDLICKTPWLFHFLDMTMSSYIMDCLLELDAGRLSEEDKASLEKFNTIIPLALVKIDDDSKDKSAFMTGGLTLDKIIHEMLYMIKTDCLNVFFMQEAKKGPQEYSMYFNQITPGHKDIAARITKLWEITLRFFPAPFIYFELALLGIGTSDANRFMEYYTSPGAKEVEAVDSKTNSSKRKTGNAPQ